MRFDVLKNKLMQLEDLSIEISDLVEKGFTYEDFRFIILSAHYRSKVNFSIKRKGSCFCVCVLAQYNLHYYDC